MEKVHNLQFHISSSLYYALLRKKAEFGAVYGCNTWKEFLYVISTLPVVTPKKIEDERRLYEIMDKLKDYNLESSELMENLQNKAHKSYTKEMKELQRQKEVLFEAIQNPDLDETERKKFLVMFNLANQTIDKIESQEK